MAIIETWFVQDLQKPVKVQYIDGNLFSHNGNGNRIGVEVYNNGTPVTLSGTVTGYAVLSDGTTVPCTGSMSGNKASILVPPAAYTPGSIMISIFLTDGTTVTTLAALSSSVIMTRTNTQVDPGSVVTDWTNTINAAMQEVETAAENLGGIIAVPYANITFPVPLGKYTYYNGGLYRCISPIASSESWTAAHWTSVRLGDDVSQLKNTFSDYIYDDLIPVEYTIVSNEYVNAISGAFVSYTGWDRTGYISIKPGEEYYYTNTVESGYNCFYNANKQRIASFSLAVNNNGNFVVPNNAYYMALSNTSAGLGNLRLKKKLPYEIKILGVDNPYYAIQAMISKLDPSPSVSYKFDTITFTINGELYTKTWSDLKADITGHSLEYDQLKVKDVKYTTTEYNKVVITPTGNFARASDGEDTPDTVVGINLGASPVYAFGAIVNYSQRTVFNLMSEINEEIPPATIADLSEAEEALFSTYTENEFLMAYYSDNHMYGFETGAEVPITALAIKRFDNHMNFDSILCCGDSVLSYKDETSAYIDDGSAFTALEKANFMLDRQKLLFVEGNHDRNINSPVMTTREFFNLMYRPLTKIPEVHFGGTGRPYFYRDFAKHKIRIICLDLYDVLPDADYNYHSGYKQNQMEWLANTALSLPDNTWHVLVATHAAPYGEADGMTDNGTPPYNSNVLIGILESFKNGTSVTINSSATIQELPSYSITTHFSTAGNLIGCFVGHNHVDVNLVKNGIHYISIECAYIEDNDKANRNAFEYSAIAFDVVVINTTNRSVAMHRIGYGNDRNYTY